MKKYIITQAANLVLKYILARTNDISMKVEWDCALHTLRVQGKLHGKPLSIVKQVETVSDIKDVISQL